MVRLAVCEFGSFKGETVKKFTWHSSHGIEVSVISYGAIIQAVKLPDKNGDTSDAVLGFDDLEGYVRGNVPYFGAAIGRCANRIAGGRFRIDGREYQVTRNTGDNHLHGGLVGFDKVNWQSTIDENKVTLSYLSRDGEEGYPGDVVANITYELKDDGSFHVEFLATTTKRTVVNLTNHSYFNLAGHDTGAEEVYNHVVTINADRITETDSESIPTGNFLKVGGTPYDFRVAKRLGDVINQASNLYDDNFCISTYGIKGISFVSRAVHPYSGRSLEIYSNQPGVQFYTANSLPSPSENALIGKDGVGYRRHGAFCFETQNYPDAVNHDNFPNAILSPGDIYDHRVVYRFGVEKTNDPVTVLA